MEAQLLSMPPQVQSLGHSAAFDSLEDSLLRDLEETVRRPNPVTASASLASITLFRLHASGRARCHAPAAD